MSPRIVSEARLLFWPWCLMTLAGLAPLIKLASGEKGSDWPDSIAVFGFFGGAAVLTALSFRHGLRICPPALSSDAVIQRRRIWSGKMGVLAVAVICAGLIACFVQMALGTIVWGEVSLHNVFEPLLLLVIIICSTGFWTLLARSMIGGLLLAAAAQFVLYLLLVLFVTLINRMAPASPGAPNLVHVPEVHAALSWFVCGFGLTYAAVMLWLGRRRFAKMEPRSDGIQPARARAAAPDHGN